MIINLIYKSLLVIYNTIDNLIIILYAKILIIELKEVIIDITKKIFKKREYYLFIEKRTKFKRLIKGIIKRVETIR